MQYRTIPKTGEKLSVLAFGCMRLPSRMGREFSSLIDAERAKRQIMEAIELGVNYLDTAYPYHMGASESFLGEHILSGSCRGKVNIATKLPCWMVKSRDDMERIFAKQMEKLSVSTIDYYLLHAIDGRTFRRMAELGVLEFMDKLKSAGKIRNSGFSFHGTKDEFAPIVDSYDWDFAQVQFNILDEHFQAGAEGIDYAAAKGMGVMVMEPLKGGSLVGRLPAEVKKIYDNASVKRAPADWALRWVMNRRGVTTVLSGMNEESQVRQNVSVAESAEPNAMTEAEQEVIAAVREAYMQNLAVRCSECGYCQPCPVGINIPAVFKNLNNYALFSKASARVHHAIYAGVRTKDGLAHWAGSCIGCGRCESLCPQHLPIRENLRKAASLMEGPLEKGGAAIARTIMGKK